LEILAPNRCLWGQYRGFCSGYQGRRWASFRRGRRKAQGVRCKGERSATIGGPRLEVGGEATGARSQESRVSRLRQGYGAPRGDAGTRRASISPLACENPPPSPFAKGGLHGPGLWVWPRRSWRAVPGEGRPRESQRAGRRHKAQGVRRKGGCEPRRPGSPPYLSWSSVSPGLSLPKARCQRAKRPTLISLGITSSGDRTSCPPGRSPGKRSSLP
jgi:hypothetical protein